MDVVAFLEGEIQRSNKTRGSRLCDPKMAASITKAIKGRKVVSSHNRNTQREGMEYKIKGLAEPPGEAKFNDDAGREWTVLEFFEKMEPPVRLRRPELPTLAMGNGRVKIPMELCPMCLRSYTISRPRSVREARATSGPAGMRLREIERFKSTMGRRQLHRAFGIDVTAGLHEVSARPSDDGYYKSPNGELVDVNVNGKGSWYLGNPNGRGDCACAAATLNEPWAVVVFRDVSDATRFLHAQAFDNFVRSFVRRATERGMRMPDRPNRVDVDVYSADAEKELQQRLSGKVRFILCVMPDKGTNELYASIKRWASSLEGIASQCAKVNKVREAKMDYISNLLLKVNLKLGGHNSFPSKGGLALLDETPTMVLGADVYHAPPGSWRPLSRRWSLQSTPNAPSGPQRSALSQAARSPSSTWRRWSSGRSSGSRSSVAHTRAASSSSVTG